MKKSEIFDILLRKVCDVCEVSAESILKGVKLQAVVDARILLVQYLRRIGLSNDDIALIVLLWNRNGDRPTLEEIKMKAKTVQKLFEAYSQRCLDSFAFCLMSTEVRDFCHEQYKDIYAHGMKPLPKK